MNIAFIIPTLGNGGAERVMSYLTHSLSDNCKKYIFTYDISSQDYVYDGEIVKLDLDFKHTVGSNPFLKIYSYIKRVKELKRAKKKYDIDIAISFLGDANIPNILSRGHEKVIISVRNFKSMELNHKIPRLEKLGILFLYNKADKIISVSKEIKEDLVQNFNVASRKVDVINNLYDIETIQQKSLEPVDDKFIGTDDSPILISAGRLCPQKGFTNLIRVFKAVLAQSPKATLIIMGRGELEKDLKKQVDDLNISDRIMFLNFQKNPFKLIKNANLFILSSHFEGFPNILVEAMICQTPVLSTDCQSGPKEILTTSNDITNKVTKFSFEEYGVLVPVCENRLSKDIHEDLDKSELMLKEAIITLLDKKELREKYSEKGLERAKDFSIDQIINHWKDIIYSTTKNNLM